MMYYLLLLILIMDQFLYVCKLERDGVMKLLVELFGV